MIRRFRLLGALAALLALSSYMAESVQATACLPVAAAGADADDMQHHAQGHDVPQDEAPDAPACPLGMAGMGGSCVAVSLPAAAAAAALAFEAPLPAVASAAPAPDLLFATPHFRPPRA